MVSAVKVGGRRLHELARAGEDVERAPRRGARSTASTSRTFEPGPYPAATVLVECGSGTYIRSLAADLGAALGGCAHLASLRRLRVGSFTARRGAPARRRSRPIPTPRCSRLATAMRDLERDRRRRRAGARRRATASAFPSRRARRRRAPGPFALVDAGGDLLAVYERRGAGVQAGCRARGAGVGRDEQRDAARRAPSTDLDAPTRAAVVTIGVYDGVHLGHQAVLRLVRELADARGLDAVLRHLRPPPGRGGAARVGAEAAHHRRAEARAARRDRLPRPLLRAALRRGAQPRAGRGVRARGARRRRCARGSSSSAPTSTSGAGAAATSRCSSRWAPSSASRCVGLGLAGARPGGPIYSSTRIRELLARGRRRAARRELLGRPHEVRGDGRAAATGGAASSGSRPPTSRCPTRICLPADGIYAGHVRRPRRRRTGRRDLARAPADLLRGRRDVAARGLRARLRRRPLRRAGRRCGSSSGSGARSASRPSRPWWSRCGATSRRPAGSSAERLGLGGTIGA